MSTQLFEDLKNLSSANRLSHSYLIHGSNPDLKISLIKDFARFLEKKENPNTPLSDFLIFGSSSQKIGIDSIRDLKRFLFQKPFFSSKRIAVVSFAENLTPEAQNSLLKISEEPLPSSLIFLLVSNKETLLPTILSRFQTLFFSSLEDSENSSSASQFLKSDFKKRLLIIKDILEEDKNSEGTPASNSFVRSLIIELSKDTQKNSSALKKVLKLNSSLSEFNLNRKIQLESLIEKI